MEDFANEGARGASRWPPGDGEAARLLREFDWNTSSLGKCAHWPQSLRTTIDLVMGSPVAMVVLWGPDLIQIYNDAYRPLLAERHPKALGQRACDCWPESWGVSGPIYERVWKGGVGALRGQRCGVHRDGRLEEAWFDFIYSPLRDEAGDVAGVLVTAIETTDHIRSSEKGERALAELARSERHLRALVEMKTVGVIFFDLDGRLLETNDAFLKMSGFTRADVEAGLNWRCLTPQEWYSTSEKALAELKQKGLTAPYEKQYVRRDGTRWWALLAAKRLDEDICAEFVIDVTERRSAEQAMRDIAERLSLATEIGAIATWDWDMRSGLVTWSDEHFRIQGYAVGSIEPSYAAWAARVHPEDLPETEAVLQRARDSRRPYSYEFRMRLPDGAIRWCTARGRFFYDDDGQPIRMIGVMQDVTDKREWIERQKVMIGELQHRTRNLLAIVRSIANQTSRAASSLEEFRETFSRRLSALSRVQGLLSRSEEEPITIGRLVHTEIEALTDPAAARSIEVGGPDVILRKSAVQTLSLALHELATNALKYGPLAGDRGTLSIRWRVVRTQEGEPRLVLEWREEGAPVRPEAREFAGYGRELIEQALPYSLGARTRYELQPDGVRCLIDLPLSQGRDT